MSGNSQQQRGDESPPVLGFSHILDTPNHSSPVVSESKDEKEKRFKFELTKLEKKIDRLNNLTSRYSLIKKRNEKFKKFSKELQKKHKDNMADLNASAVHLQAVNERLNIKQKLQKMIDDRLLVIREAARKTQSIRNETRLTEKTLEKFKKAHNVSLFLLRLVMEEIGRLNEQLAEGRLNAEKLHDVEMANPNEEHANDDSSDSEEPFLSLNFHSSPQDSAEYSDVEHLTQERIDRIIIDIQLAKEELVSCKSRFFHMREIEEENASLQDQLKNIKQACSTSEEMLAASLLQLEDQLMNSWCFSDGRRLERLDARSFARTLRAMQQRVFELSKKKEVSDQEVEEARNEYDVKHDELRRCYALEESQEETFQSKIAERNSLKDQLRQIAETDHTAEVADLVMLNIFNNIYQYIDDGPVASTLTRVNKRWCGLVKDLKNSCWLKNIRRSVDLLVIAQSGENYVIQINVNENNSKMTIFTEDPDGSGQMEWNKFVDDSAWNNLMKEKHVSAKLPDSFIQTFSDVMAICNPREIRFDNITISKSLLEFLSGLLNNLPQHDFLHFGNRDGSALSITIADDVESSNIINLSRHFVTLRNMPHHLFGYEDFQKWIASGKADTQFSFTVGNVPKHEPPVPAYRISLQNFAQVRTYSNSRAQVNVEEVVKAIEIRISKNSFFQWDLSLTMQYYDNIDLAFCQMLTHSGTLQFTIVPEEMSEIRIENSHAFTLKLVKHGNEVYITVIQIHDKLPIVMAASYKPHPLTYLINNVF